MNTVTKEIGFQEKLTATVALVEQVNALVVTTAEEYHTASEKINHIRNLEKELESEYKTHPVIIEAKKLQALKTDLAAMLETARKTTKSKMFAFEAAEENKRKAAEEHLRAEAQKKADEEARIAAEIERKKAEAARAEAARAKAKGDVEAERLAREKQEAAKAEAERIKEEARTAVVPEIILSKSVPKVAGHKSRTICVPQIQDKEKVINFVLKNPAFIGFLSLDETAIRKYGESMGKAASIPGIMFEFRKV